MTKRICTTSIFVALLAGIAALCLCPAPNDGIWFDPYFNRGHLIHPTLLPWLVVNIVGPLAFAAIVCILVSLFGYMLWTASEALCSWARRGFGEKPEDRPDA